MSNPYKGPFDDGREPYKDAFTEREWRLLPRIGSNGCSMVKPVRCVHGALLTGKCVDCAAEESL